jgi:hypothetical protein
MIVDTADRTPYGHCHTACCLIAMVKELATPFPKGTIRDKALVELLMDTMAKGNDATASVQCRYAHSSLVAMIMRNV